MLASSLALEGGLVLRTAQTESLAPGVAWIMPRRWRAHDIRPVHGRRRPIRRRALYGTSFLAASDESTLRSSIGGGDIDRPAAGITR
jgi:hypothetical protein